jgi:hypothetical protein
VPEMTTSVRWTAEETRRTVLLVFSALTALNVGRRLIVDRRVGVGEALAGVGAILLLWREFGRRTQPEATPAAEPAESESVPA